MAKYQVGQKLDIIADDIYCPAIIVALPSPECIKIHFLGWPGTQFDEVIDTTTSAWRIAPPFTGTKLVKVWVYLNESYPFWPGIAYVRCPAPSERDKTASAGVEYLQQEKTVFVEVIASQTFSKAVDGGLWVDSKRIYSFLVPDTKLRPQPKQGIEQYRQSIQRHVNVLLAHKTSLYCHLSFKGSFESTLFEAFVLKNREKLQLIMDQDAGVRGPNKPKTKQSFLPKSRPSNTSTEGIASGKGGDMPKKRKQDEEQLEDRELKMNKRISLYVPRATQGNYTNETTGPSELAKLIVDSYYDQPKKHDGSICSKVSSKRGSLQLTSFSPQSAELTLSNELSFRILNENYGAKDQEKRLLNSLPQIVKQS